jgi:hypothetical protein
MALVGHKTESIYRRYAIVNESDLSQGVRKLARSLERGHGNEEEANEHSGGGSEALEGS